MYTTRTYEAPINYRTSTGAFAPIDDSLVADSSAGSGAVENSGNSWHAVFPGHLGGGEVSLTNDGTTIGFSARGAADVAVSTSGSTADYAGAFPDADLSYEARNDEVKEQIVLSSASAASSYTFPLDVPSGLTPEMLSGGIVFVDSSGNRASISIAPATVQDASGPQSDPFSNVTMSLQQSSSGGWQIVVSVDQSWLDSPDRQFPVTIDPTLVSSVGQTDCWIYSAAPTTSACSTAYMDLGNSGSSIARIMMNFPVSGIPRDALVAQAAVGVDFSSGTAVSGVGAYALTRAWTSSATWNTYDGTHSWTTPGGDYSTISDSEPIAAAGGFAYWYLNSSAQYWVNYPTQNYGVLLKADTAGTVRGAYNTLSTSNQAYWPYLQVKWVPRIGEPAASPMISIPTSDGSTFEVNAANGNGELHDPVMHIAGTGLDFDLGMWTSTLAPAITDSGGQSGIFGFNPGPAERLWVAFGGSASGAQFNPEISGPDGVSRIYSPVPGQSYYTAPGIDSTLAYNSTNQTWVLLMDDSGDTYDFQGNTGANNYGDLVGEQDRDGDTIIYHWTTTGTAQLTSVTDTQGRTITPSYGADNMVSKWTDSTGRSATFNLTSGGMLTSWTNTGGGTTQYAYGVSGTTLPTQITDPDGDITNIAYNSSGQISSVTREASPPATGGPEYQFAYSTTLNSHCETTDPYAVISQTTVTDPNGNQTIYCTDVDDRVATEIDPAGNVTSYSYYDAGLDDPTSVTLPNSATNATSYQSVAGVYNGNSATNTISGSGMSTLSLGSSAYSNTGANQYLASSGTDSQANSSCYLYDAYGNVTQITDALSYTPSCPASSTNSIDLTYSSTHPGWLTQSTDPAGHATSYGYDSVGNLTSITPPSPLGAETIGYDGLSRRTSFKDGDGNTTTYTYDGQDRVKTTTYQDGTIVTNNYDADGNLTSEVDPSGITTNTYNSLGQLTQTVLATGQTLGYGYDSDGNLSSFTDGVGTVNYTYNNLNQLTKMVEPGGNTTTFTYNTLGQRTTTTLPNGIVETYTYDAAGQPLTLVAKNAGGTTLASQTYTYAAGSTTTSLIQTVTDQSGNVTTYTYDPLNRLTEAKTVNGSSTISDDTYAYDAAGNITTQTVGGTTTSYGYNGANQAISWDGYSTGTYDADGNLTNMLGVNFAYNARDQTTTAATASYSFFGNGQDDQTDDAGITMLNSALGLSATTYSGTTDYITSDSSGQPLGENTPSGQFYFITDPRGTVLDVTNNTGAIVRTNSYDPWGNQATSGSGPNDIAYLGTDPGAGLTHFGARIEWPALQRWTQPDPEVTSLVDDPTMADPYVYAGDDPINNIDPSGNIPIPNRGCLVVVAFLSICDAKVDLPEPGRYFEASGRGGPVVRVYRARPSGSGRRSDGDGDGDGDGDEGLLGELGQAGETFCDDSGFC